MDFAAIAAVYRPHMTTVDDHDLIQKAKGYAEPLLERLELTTGEQTLHHVRSVVEIIRHIGGSVEMQATPYLVFACEELNKPQELLAISFGPPMSQLAFETHRILQLLRQANAGQTVADQSRIQIEKVRRMLLAFSKDIRVVILLMASQLQNLRYTAALKKTGFEWIAHDTLSVFAPLANRLGIWQMKWEMEDLALRILEPSTYKQVASQLEVKRVERESEIESMRIHVQQELQSLGIVSVIQGRPKHIFSIVKKMRGKSLQFNQVLDLRALRIIVQSVDECYRVLSWVHSEYQMLETEFDDYIAKPKTNGYQSLHTVVKDRDAKIFEIQIRTHDMHGHAEHGVAAHWAYKEAGVRGYAGAVAPTDQANKVAVLRQLLAWERDLTTESKPDRGLATSSVNDEKIYVLTPDAAIVELPQGATPIDFAYTLHTEVGHKCRGAKLDGVLVPLNTVLQNGQTVEISTIKDGGPSRDWLNPELGYVASSRAKSKVRAWFNAQKSHQTIARGRELVEKLLQREGRTAYKLEDLAQKLGFVSASNLFEVVGKDEFSLRNIELVLRPVEHHEPDDEIVLRKVHRHKKESNSSGVLVVGMDSLLTQLARCCRPVPPDLIKGFVTKGQGVSVHRVSCRNFLELMRRSSDRVIDVTWGHHVSSVSTALYPVDVEILADDRQGLLRDISEVFAKEKMNVVGVNTQSVKGVAWMTFTVEVMDASRMGKVQLLIKDVLGVRSVRRHGS